MTSAEYYTQELAEIELSCYFESAEMIVYRFCFPIDVTYGVVDTINQGD